MAISLTGALAAVIVVGGVAGALVLRDARLQLRAERAEHAAFVAETRAAGAQAETDRIIVEIMHADQVKQAKAEGDARMRQLGSKFAALAADHGGLLNDIAADPSRGQTGEAALAACRERTFTLGRLLGAADQRADRDAGELEALNDEKRVLLESWPK